MLNASPAAVSAPPLRPARAVWALGLAAVLGAVLLPIAVVLAHLFVPTGDLWAHLSSTVLPRYIVNTLWLIAGVGVLTLIGGVGTAWLVSLCGFPGRRFFSWALLLPFAMPAYVIAYTYTGLLDFSGPVQSGLRDLFGWSAGDYPAPNIRSLTGAIVMLSLVLYPYVYLLSRSAFLEQSICSLEVSRTLGCTPAQAMWRVALPLARPSIVAGMALALLEALNEFGAMQHFGVDTFTTGIFRVWLADGSPAAAAKLASVFLIFVFAILVLERRSRGRAAFHNLSIRYRPLPGWRLAGWRAAFAVIFCATPVVFGFAAPRGGAALVDLAVRRRGRQSPDFVRLLLTSVALAGSAALITVAVALFLAYAARRSASRLFRGLTRLAAIGYAVPGAVLAVGIVIPFAALDERINAFGADVFGLSPGLIFSGTVFALLFAYAVRFLAISYGAVDGGLTRITGHMDDAARTLGAGATGVVRRIHAPMLRPSIAAAGLLIFVDVLKELPATLLLRPFGIDTLALRTYEYATDEQLVEAAPSALAIVLAGILPVILLSRAMRRSSEPREAVGVAPIAAGCADMMAAPSRTRICRSTSLTHRFEQVTALEADFAGHRRVARSSLCSARRAAASPPCCAWLPGWRAIQHGTNRHRRKAGRCRSGPQSAARTAQRRLPVPGLRALSASERGRQRRLRPSASWRCRAAQTGRRRARSASGCPALASAFPHTLSGGQQQRIALARALAPSPGMLLLDEPLSGLDARLRHSLADRLLAILRETGTTAVVVTHDSGGGHVSLPTVSASCATAG